MESKEQEKKYNVSEFTLKTIIKSTNKLYKYTAVLSNDVIIHFGCCHRDGEAFQHYRDRTGLNLYTEYDNYDPIKRRAWYIKNKAFINKNFLSSKSLEYIFLQT